MNEEYLTVKDVASKLGVKQVTAYKWIREGKLDGTFFKMGGVYRFKQYLLDEKIEGMIKND